MFLFYSFSYFFLNLYNDCKRLDSQQTYCSCFSLLTCWDKGEGNLYSFLCNGPYPVIPAYKATTDLRGFFCMPRNVGPGLRLQHFPTGVDTSQVEISAPEAKSSMSTMMPLRHLVIQVFALKIMNHILFPTP